MLATPVAYGDVYKELSDAVWHVEDKYDGIRAQAHVRDGKARIFSRRLNEVTASYPEIAQALDSISGAAILDGEIVAVRDGRVLPFRLLQARLQRKTLDPALLRDVPIAYMVFDLLAFGEEMLLDEPQSTRRERLCGLFTASDNLVLAPFESVRELAGADVNARFEAARSRGNEGLMLKRADAPYVPGRRGNWWRSSSASSRPSMSSSSPSSGETASAPAFSPTTPSPCAATTVACAQ